MSEPTLNQAIDAIKAGHQDAARAILSKLLTSDPKNERAWLWLATCFDEPERKKYCLSRVLEINPQNQDAKDAWRRLDRPPRPSLDELVTIPAAEPSRPTMPNPDAIDAKARGALPEPEPMPLDSVAPEKEARPASLSQKAQTPVGGRGAVPWYRQPGCMIVWLLFFTPAFVILFVTDPRQSKRSRIALAIVAPLLFCCCVALGALAELNPNRPSQLGTRLEFNSGELYFTAAVTKEDATKLGNYLTESAFFDGTRKTVQLNKTSDTYEFRMVVKKGLEQDQDTIDAVRTLGQLISSNVFDNMPVDVHLCDENLKTSRVVTAGPSLGTRLEFNGSELYFTPQVNRDEATKLGNYLVKQQYFGTTPVTVQLNKLSKTYEVRMVVKKGIDRDEVYVNTLRTFARQLSQDVFGGAQVDIHMCDENLKTLRVVPQ